MKWVKGIMWSVTGLMFVVTTVSLPWMPDRMPMHFNMAGEIDRWGSKYENLLFPLFAVAMAAFFAYLASYYEKKSHEADADAGEDATAKEAAGHRANANVLWMTGAVMAVYFACLQGSILYSTYRAQTEGQPFPSEVFSRLVFVLMGALFVILGGLIPRTARNGTVGVRVPWSLYNETTWRRSNRFGGILMIAAGVAVIVTALLADVMLTLLLIPVYLLAAVAAMLVYAHHVWRQEKDREPSQSSAENAEKS